MKIYMKLRKINENDALMNRSEYEMKQQLSSVKLNLDQDLEKVPAVFSDYVMINFQHIL